MINSEKKERQSKISNHKTTGCDVLPLARLYHQNHTKKIHHLGTKYSDTRVCEEHFLFNQSVLLLCLYYLPIQFNHSYILQENSMVLVIPLTKLKAEIEKG